MNARRIAILAAALVAGCVKAPPRAAAPIGRVVHLDAKRFEFTPATVTLTVGEPVTLELASLDLTHGFFVPALDLHAEIPANGTIQIPFTPQKTGSFPFHCDRFCGSGHEGMTGAIEVR